MTISVTGFTAERMLEIENDTVVSGAVSGDNLNLTTRGGSVINAGNVRGPVGPVGPVGGAVSGSFIPVLQNATVGTGASAKNNARYAFSGGGESGQFGFLSLSGLISLGTGFSLGDETTPLGIALPSEFQAYKPDGTTNIGIPFGLAHLKIGTASYAIEAIATVSLHPTSLTHLVVYPMDIIELDNRPKVTRLSYVPVNTYNPYSSVGPGTATTWSIGNTIGWSATFPAQRV